MIWGFLSIRTEHYFTDSVGIHAAVPSFSVNVIALRDSLFETG
jgi:hypothetical protein